MENKWCKHNQMPMIGNYVMCPYLKFETPKGVFTGKFNYICTKDNKNCEVKIDGEQNNKRAKN